MSFAESMLDRGMNVAGEIWPSADTMKRLFQDVGLTRDESGSVLEKVSDALNKWPVFAEECEVPTPMIVNVRERIARIRQSVFNTKGASVQPSAEITPADEIPGRKSGKRFGI